VLFTNDIFMQIEKGDTIKDTVMYHDICRMSQGKCPHKYYIVKNAFTNMSCASLKIYESLLRYCKLGYIG